MPRSPTVYTLPAGTTVAPNTTIESSWANALTADIAQTFNTAQPIVYGGTGATTAGAAADALSPAFADVASGATTNIGAATSPNVNITGTTTITAFDNVTAGIKRFVKFAGALTLTHNGTSLILPGAANITTAAGDTAIFVSEGSGNWRCIIYQRASGDIVAVNITQTGTFTHDGTAGDITMDTGGANFAFSRNGPNEITAIGGASATLDIQSGAALTWSIGTSPTEIARVSTDGLGIGRVPLSGTRLSVRGQGTTSGTYALQVEDSAGNVLLRTRDDGYLISPPAYNQTTGAAANAFFASDGGFFRSTSSSRYKKNIRDLAYSVAEIAALEPKKYNGKSEVDEGKTFGGLISETLAGGPFDMFVERGKEGQAEGIMYGPLGAVLAVSLAKELIKALARIDALEKKLV